MKLSELRERTTVSVEEAGEIIGLSRSSAYEAARRGDIPILRLGRRIFVPVPRLLALLGAAEDEKATATEG